MGEEARSLANLNFRLNSMTKRRTQGNCRRCPSRCQGLNPVVVQGLCCVWSGVALCECTNTMSAPPLASMWLKVRMPPESLRGKSTHTQMHSVFVHLKTPTTPRWSSDKCSLLTQPNALSRSELPASRLMLVHRPLGKQRNVT